MIVMCQGARNAVGMMNPMMRNSKIIPYTDQNIQMITSVYPHPIPNVDRNGTMCRNHYMLNPMGMGGMTYEQYREKMDSWMQM